MGNEQLLKELSDYIADFEVNDTDIEIAKAILALYNDSTPNLSTLLMGYHNSEPVFRPLINDKKTTENTALIVHLIEVNSDILHLPMSEGGVPNDTLLQFILDEKDIFEDVIAWLEEHKPEVMAAEKKRACDLEQLHKLGLDVLKKNPQRFPALFVNQSIKSIHQLFAAFDNKLLQKLLVPPLDNLNFLVNCDFSILHIAYEDEDLFNYLCEDPYFYIPTLEIIRKKYTPNLSRGELTLLDNALKEKQEPINVAEWAPDFLKTINVKAAKFNIIQHATLRALALPESHFSLDNERIKRFINTQDMIDNAVLDVYIARTFGEKLMKLGMVVMPTIRHTEAILADQIARIIAGEPIFYPSDISIKNDKIAVCNIAERAPRKNIRYIIWPMNNEEKIHYGLFILDVIENKGYYIEPLRLENILSSFERNIESLLAAPIDYTRLTQDAEYRRQLLPQLSPFFYKHYLEQATKDLPLKQEDIRYMHLAQDFDEHCCSDYLIAILARLAAGEIDLVSNLDSLLALEAHHLSKDAVIVIRLLEIQLFRMDYFKYQLEPSFKNPAALLSIEQDIFPAKISANAELLSKCGVFSDSKKQTIRNQLQSPAAFPTQITQKFKHEPLVRSPLGKNVITVKEVVQPPAQLADKETNDAPLFTLGK